MPGIRHLGKVRIPGFSISCFRRVAALYGLVAAAVLSTAGAGQDVPAPASGVSGVRPRIAIIIDDLGRHFDAGQRVIDLHGPVACAFLPYGRHTEALAHIAHAEGKEVMLHLPMQAMERTHLDRGALMLDMNRRQLESTMRRNLAMVPHVSGVNNHMGSLLTRHPGHMAWVMEVLRERRPLFFVDSRTTHKTVAHRLADENRIPAVSRDVFLDANPDKAAVQAPELRLLRVARKKGTALAIGHPHETTLRVLARELDTLDDRGVSLVPVRRLARIGAERDSTWQLSLSRSQRDLKSSKQ